MGARESFYLWVPDKGLVYLTFVYGKDETDTLTADQKKQLRVVVTAIKDEHRGRKGKS